MKNSIVIGLSIFVFFAVDLKAQYTPDNIELDNYKNLEEYAGSYFSDGFGLIKSPLKWQKKDLIILGSTVVVGTLVYLYDDEIRNLVQRNRSNFTNNLSKNFVEPFGSGKYSLPILGLLYLYGEVKHDHKSKRVALDGVKTFVFAATASVFLKYVFGRHRPYDNAEPNSRMWEGPFGSSYTAFPSGHSTVSFALATYISSAYREKTWLSISAYSMATLVALSRINDDKHWASDVFAGAILGYAIGKFVHKHSIKERKIKILPVSRNGLGISIIKTL